MYVGEDRTLIPIALDATGEVVYGSVYTWSSSNLGAVTVTAGGTLATVSAGTATITASADGQTAVVTVTVLAGERPEPSDSNPEYENCGSVPTAIVPPPDISCPIYINPQAPFPPLDGGEGNDASISISTPIAARNGVGTPYNQAVMPGPGSPTPVPMHDVLGSSNYTFTAPILGALGRELGLDLSLVFNSQLWTYDATANQLTFNYDKGWPAAGWRLGFGRIIQNYDGNGVVNTNHHLLITPDGTRIPLLPDSAGGSAWTHSASNGSYIKMKKSSAQMVVIYPDGTRIRYVNTAATNSKWLPDQVKTRNGNYLSITYVRYDPTHPENFPIKWAIQSISDSLGRTFTFKYANTRIGDPERCVYGQLRSIEGPGPEGTTVVYAKIEYDVIQVHPVFSGVLVVGPKNNQDTDIVVVKRITYPETGRGYLFSDFSPYGMPKTISVRRAMNGALAPDGVETTSTAYSYNDTGTFSGGDLPEYSDRTESIRDDAGSLYQTSQFSYMRTEDSSGAPLSSTVSSNVLNTPVIETTSDPDTGRQSSVKYQQGTTALRTIAYGYDPGGSTQQPTSVDVTEQGLTTRTEYTYGTYDRLLTVRETGFGGSPVLRTTTYSYIGGSYVTSANLLYLVDLVKIYSGTETGGTLVSQTDYNYDETTPNGYGLSTAIAGHDLAGYGTGFNLRGNPTSVTYSPISGTQTTPITRARTFDIFGNVLTAQVSCCQTKVFAYSAATSYSRPNTATDGATAPSLTTSFTYDPNTMLVKTVTSPGGQVSSLVYDTAWRATVETMRRRGGASDDVRTTMTYADAAKNDNQTVTSVLEYKEKYTDSFNKTITEVSWFDGAGRTLRSGTLRAGGTSTYDLVAAEYDGIGRMLRQSTPYVSTGSAGNWTNYSFDVLSRPTGVTLADSSTATTSYLDSTTLGARTIDMTDPAGRVRQHGFDALGRLSKVTEDPGAAGYVTNYSYDTLDNLTLSDQGGQKREYLFDGLSRLLFERTPEQSAPHSYGGKSWSVKYEYNDFADVTKMTDARQVETHYGFDTLNRPISVDYTAVGGGALSPDVATNSTTISYFSTADERNGQVNQISNTTATEVYTYDLFSRVSTNTRTIAGKAFAASTYLYTTAGQMIGMKYPAYSAVTPSPKQLRINHDERGRFSGLDQGTWNGSLVFTLSKSHVSNVTYGGANNTTPLALTKLQLGANVKENYTYSQDRLQLTHQDVQKVSNSQTLMSFDYGYVAPNGKNAGQVTTINSTVNITSTAVEQYAYDQMSRLTSATKTTGGTAPLPVDTIGTYDPASSFWALRSQNNSGPVDFWFGFGAAGGGYLPITGDWNNDGTDTPGLYQRSSGVFLEDENGSGSADYSFSFGPANSNWLPVAGDWNGLGGDSIGLYNPTASTFFLKNANSAGDADVTPFQFGNANSGWLPIVGDWDGNGTDTIGLYDPATGTFYLRNSNTAGAADATFVFGGPNSSALPVAGDWDGNGADSIGFYLPSSGTWSLRNSNTAGGADYTFSFSTGGQPVTGDWNGAPITGTSWNQTYVFDRWGNRTQMTTTLASGPSTQNVTIVKDASNIETNRIATVGVVAQYYDANGNLTNDGTYTYTYDAANRLATVTSIATGTQVGRYSYDAANRRVKQKGSTSTATWSLWEGMHVVAEYTGMDTGNPSSLAAQYIFAGDRMVAKEVGVDTYYIHPDRLSTRMMTLAAGTIAGTQSHRPFGELDTSSNATDKHWFTNYERDAQGGDYAINRQYEFAVGRFAQVDPVDGSPQDPQSMNRFDYSLNDPTNVLDPMGLQSGEMGPPADPITLHGSAPPPVDASHPFFASQVPFIPESGESGLSKECLLALSAAGQGPESVDRASAQIPLLNELGGKYGIGSKILLALGIRESGFQNLSDKSGGRGVGVFQLDANYIKDIPTDFAGQADLAMSRLASQIKKYERLGVGGEVAIMAGIRTYNRGTAYSKRHGLGTNAMVRRGYSTAEQFDQGTAGPAGGNYVSNVLQIAMYCFQSETQ